MWDSRADGYGRGEGTAAVILTRLSDALAAGDMPALQDAIRFAVRRLAAADSTTSDLDQVRGIALLILTDACPIGCWTGLLMHDA